MARSDFDSAPVWRVDELDKRVDKLERERWEDRDRRFRLWLYLYMAAFVIAGAASVVLSIAHAAAD